MYIYKTTIRVKIRKKLQRYKRSFQNVTAYQVDLGHIGKSLIISCEISLWSITSSYRYVLTFPFINFKACAMYILLSSHIIFDCLDSKYSQSDDGFSRQLNCYSFGILINLNY